jgi:segregation and condensation protein B
MKPRCQHRGIQRLPRKPSIGGGSAQGLAARLVAAQAAGRLRLWTPAAVERHSPVRRRGRKPRVARGVAARETPVPGLHPRSDELARLEAVLYLAREPLSVRRLARLARLTDGSRARVLLAELKRLQIESGSAFRVEQIAGGFQLLTRSPFGPWVRRMLQSPAETRLSQAAMETLAVVAYRQPVTRSEIEAIRGVGCEEMLRQLLERDFVAVGGRIEELGRPNVYVTTRRFLQGFGLARMEDLPPISSVSATGEIAGPAA